MTLKKVKILNLTLFYVEGKAKEWVKTMDK